MGLLTGLLTLPLAPARGVAWIADRLEETAERETADPAVLRARLAALNRALDEGEIDQERFELEEERLLDLLRAAHRARFPPTPHPHPREVTDERHEQSGPRHRGRRRVRPRPHP